MSEGMLGNIPLSEIQGPANDLEQKLAGTSGRQWLWGLKRFLRKENPWPTPPLWTITTCGRTGEQWIDWLERRGCTFYANDDALLRGEKFVVTNGVPYRLGVIRACEINVDRPTATMIRAEAARRGYLTPPAEVGPYLREAVSDQEMNRMGFPTLIVMHEPITIPDPHSQRGYSVVFALFQGENRLVPSGYSPDHTYGRDDSFVFLVPASE